MEESGEFVDMIKIVVYQATFQSIAWLYHIIGHEGVHVYELATIATTYEYHAYMWNLRHVYHPFPFPLGRRKLEALLEMRKWDRPKFKERKGVNYDAYKRIILQEEIR